MTRSGLTETTAYLYSAPHTIYLSYAKIFVCFLGPIYYKLFCLNDSPDTSDSKRYDLKIFLENLFPDPSPFEKP